METPAIERPGAGPVEAVGFYWSSPHDGRVGLVYTPTAGRISVSVGGELGGVTARMPHSESDKLRAWVAALAAPGRTDPPEAEVYVRPKPPEEALYTVGRAEAGYWTTRRHNALDALLGRRWVVRQGGRDVVFLDPMRKRDAQNVCKALNAAYAQAWWRNSVYVKMA
jgi:hypothetical protein